MGIETHLRIITAGIGLLLLMIIFELIRRERLKERYALLWLITGVAGLVWGIWPQSLVMLSKLLHLHHLTTMMMFVFLFLISIVLHFSIAISRLTERNKTLIQQIALLDQRLQECETRVEGVAKNAGGA